MVTQYDTAVEHELVGLAQAGDVASLGQLLNRHRPAMTAVALAMLAQPADAEDVVQDAMVVALNRIADLRDPAALGPWLRMIVRNGCRMRLRGPAPLPVADIGRTTPDPADDPARLLERHSFRDWAWHAVERLSPQLRLVTMLRYFTDTSTYEQISAICGVPVGTVRSRLNAARTTLSRELLASASTHHTDVGALTRARHDEARQTLAAGPQGSFGDLLRETWHPDVETTWADGRRTHGIGPLVEVMDAGQAAGVRQRLVDVVASRDIAIWDIDVLNPAADPAHCPPRTSWLLFLDGGRVRRFRQFHQAASGS